MNILFSSVVTYHYWLCIHQQDWQYLDEGVDTDSLTSPTHQTVLFRLKMCRHLEIGEEVRDLNKYRKHRIVFYYWEFKRPRRQKEWGIPIPGARIKCIIFHWKKWWKSYYGICNYINHNIFILFPYYINSMEVAIRLKNGISILFPMKTTLFP